MPAAPTASTPAASPSSQAPAAPAVRAGRRAHRRTSAHPVTSAPAAPAPASANEPEAPEETETKEDMEKRIRKEIEKEAAEKKEQKKLKNRVKRIFKKKDEDSKLKKLAKKLFKFAVVIMFIYVVIQACNPFGLAEDSPGGSNGSGIGESTVSKGIRPESGTRADQFFPKLSIDGANKVLTFEDPTAPTSLKMTFQVTVDEDNTITQVDLSDSMLKYGYVKFGTKNNSDDNVGYCREKSCDFTDKSVNLCETWMFEQRQIPAAGGSEFAARFWSAREYDQAMTDDSSKQVYPGDSGGNSRLCGGKY
jgi:hypothetical protein